MASGLAPGLARKVSKVLDLRTEAPEVLQALTTLSEFYSSNSAADRRQLRATIERRGVAINQEYLAAAEQVIQALEAVEAEAAGLSAGCARAKAKLAAAKDSSSGLLAATERLQQELAANARRGELVQEFLAQYQLSGSEAAALQAPEIGEAFFAALERVHAIHANCKALLRTHHQRAGLELMDAMAAHQEAAYERLCRWVQAECRRIGDGDAPDAWPLLQRAAAALRERPVLYKYCALEVAGTRHNALFQRFITALTRGGPGGMPRPIEMHAHDPRRYVGDMLAWVHQALASERELLAGLFGGEEAVQAQAATGVADAPRTPQLLDRVFESICRPLKVRVEQVLMSPPPLLLCFHLSQLLAFYTSLVDRLLGSDAGLTKALAACRHLAARQFQEQLRTSGARLLRNPPPPPRDLAPPPQVGEALQQLADIVASFEASMETSDGDAGDLAPVLAAALDPLLEAVRRSAEALSPTAHGRLDAGRPDASAQRIYLLNCLAAVEQTLAGRPSCAARAQEVAASLEQQLQALVAGAADGLLARCGLAEIVGRMRLYRGGDAPGEGVMAADAALALPRIEAAVRAFAALLSQPEAQPEFRSLQVPRMRTQAVLGVASALAEAYQLVHECLADPACGYSEQADAGAALSHTPEEIRTILGIV